MSRPVMPIVDDDTDARRAIADALVRRFGLIVCAGCTEAGLHVLQHLTAAGANVELVLAVVWIPGMGDIELLSWAHSCYPDPRCGLLQPVGDNAAIEPLLHATGPGQVDFRICRPWASPEKWLYPRSRRRSALGYPCTSPGSSGCRSSASSGHSEAASCMLGVFNVGDVRSGSERRAASAVGEGSVTIRSV
jgi:hypothetical protein